MKEYQVKSEDAKNFSLTIHDKEIGRLKYEKWFSFKAEMIMEGIGTYQIVPKGFWGTTIELKQNENILLNFKMNWNGNIIISTRFEGSEIDFILKHKGLFKAEEEFVAIQPEFKCRKFNYDYKLATTA